MDGTAQRFFEAERLRLSGDLRAAEAAYRSLLEAQPRHAGGLEGLAAIHEAAGRSVDAEDCRRRAGAVRAAATADVAAALLFHGDTRRGRQCCEQALALDDDCLKAHWLLGDVEARAGDVEAALTHYRRCQEIAPDRLGPGFLIAALGAGDVPGRAPADYVTAQFDWYAETFDDHLQNTLLYRGPEYVARALKAAYDGSAPTVLDLGCGTGLLAPEIAGFAGRLTGVDLSPGMIAKATVRGGYDALVTDDVIDFLADWPAGSADIVVAVDMAVYLGDLAPLFAGVARALRAGGLFVLTTERWDARDPKDPPGDRAWRLRPNGRYQHARDALVSCAAGNGFTPPGIEDCVLRYELGMPVDSDLVVMRRA